MKHSQIIIIINDIVALAKSLMYLKDFVTVFEFKTVKHVKIELQLEHRLNPCQFLHLLLHRHDFHSLRHHCHLLPPLLRPRRLEGSI